MGNEASKPVSSDKEDLLEQADAIPSPTPAQTPAKDSWPGPLTPEMTPPRSYGPLTPPPSGISKEPPIHVNSRLDFRHATPTPPETPTTPSPAHPLPHTPASLPTPLTTPYPSRPTPKQTPSSPPCSECRRPIPHTKASPAIRPLKCGHTLCLRCIRAALLASLTTGPFTPAACPCCRSARAADGPNSSTWSTPSADSKGGPGEAGRQGEEEGRGGGEEREIGPAIPLAALGAAASPAEFLAYGEKLRERRTPAPDRLYCHDRDRCGMFLSGSARRRARSATCPLCGRRTCALCGGRAHFFGWVAGPREGDKATLGGTKRNGKRRVALGRRERKAKSEGRVRKGLPCQQKAA